MTKPTAPVTPRVTDTPTLGARVTNRRGGDLWPGSSLTVTELPSADHNLVLARDPDGIGRLLHPSPTHPGRWNLGSRTVAFVAAPAEQATGSAEPTDAPQTPDAVGRVARPQLHMGVEVTGPFGARVTCGCGLSTRGYAKRDVGRAWDEHNAHALSALREAVSVAYAVMPDAGSSSDTTPSRLCDLCTEPFADPEVCPECQQAADDDPTNFQQLVTYVYSLDSGESETSRQARVFVTLLNSVGLTAHQVSCLLAWASALGDAQLTALVYNAAADEDLD